MPRENADDLRNSGPLTSAIVGGPGVGRVDRPGIGTALVSDFMDSVIGSLAFKTLPDAVAGYMSTDEPGFDPYKAAGSQYKGGTDAYFAAKPWMLKPFTDGTMDHVASQSHMEALDSMAERDYRRHQMMDNASWYVKYPSMIAAQAPDMILGGIAGRAVGLAPYLGELAQWAGKGSLLQKAAKGAAVGAGFNTVYDQTIAAVDPLRPMFQPDDLKNDVLAGVAIGGVAIPAITHAFGYVGGEVGKGMSAARDKYVRAKAAEDIIKPEAKLASDAVKEQADELRKMVAKVDEATAANAAGASRANAVPGGVLHDTTSLLSEHVSGDGLVHKWIINSPETRPLIDRLKEAFGSQIEFHPHPEQKIYDAKLAAEDILSIDPASMPSKLGVLAAAAEKFFSLPFSAAKITQNPLAKHASLLMHDLLDLSAKPAWMADALDPNVRNAPAEMLRWGLDGHHKQAQAALGKIFGEAERAGGFTWKAADGRVLDFKSATKDRAVFDAAMRDAIDRVNAVARGETGPHTQLVKGEGQYQTPTPLMEMPEHLRSAIEAYKKFTDVIHEKGVQAGLLPEKTPDAIYVPQLWDTEKVRLDPEAFAGRLAQAAANDRFRRNRLAGKDMVEEEVASFKRDEQVFVPHVNGKVVGPNGEYGDYKGLDVADRLAIKTAAELKGGYDKLSVDDLKEIGVSAQRYREENALYDAARAKATAKTLTAPSNGHGLGAGMHLPDTFKKRLINVSNTEMRDWLRDGVLDSMDSMAYRIHGKIAGVLAIKNNGEMWSKFVKHYTGEDLAARNYDPHVVADAIERQLDEAAATAKSIGDDKLAERYRVFKAASTQAIRDHIDNMLNGRPGPDPNASVLWGVRQTQRLTTMATQGTSLLSNINDSIAPMAMNMLGHGGLSGVARIIRVLAKAEMPHPDLENILAVNQDLGNQFQAVQLGDMPHFIEKEPFGPGLKGKVMTAIDKTTAKMTSAFYNNNGMRWWANGNRVAAANSTYAFINEGAQRLVHAADLIAGGMEREKALAKAGLGEGDFQQLGNAGINITRARQILDVMDKYGTDIHGNRIGRTHKGFVSLNAAKWADANPELYDTITGAVNSNALNMSLEPKQGYQVMLNKKSATARLVNTMSSFTMSFGAQWGSILLRRTGSEQAAWLATSLAMGAVTDALHNHISGRRSLSDTADAWESNPAGMIYAAMDRAGWAGWGARFLGPLESAHLGPGSFLGNNQLSGMYSRPGRNMLDSAVGPAFQYLHNVSDFFQGNIASALKNGTYDQRAMRTGYKTLPYNNWLVIRGINRMSEAANSGTPFGPPPR